MAHPLKIRIVTAEELIPLDPGIEPQLDLVGELDNGRELYGESGEDLTNLPWHITIERLSEQESLSNIANPPDHKGSVFTLPEANAADSINVMYKASATAFDRMNQIFARRTPHVWLTIRIGDLRSESKRIAISWPNSRQGSQVLDAQLEVAYQEEDSPV